MTGAPWRGGPGSQERMPEIHLPVFEGPLELLLRLIEREDLDITAISLVAVTDQYLGAIRAEQGTDPDALAEFVAIGAKLIYLKSRALLPRPPAVEADDALLDDEVGQELVELLVEYRRFKEVAQVLAERQEAGVRVYPRLAPPPAVPEGPGLQGVTVDAMRKIMLDVLRRLPAPPRHVIRRDRVTMTTVIERVRDQLRRSGRVSFRKLLEVIVSFLAVLEMLKGGECDAAQATPFGDIDIVAVKAAA
jgi:segregation and condensation protein A